MHRVISATAICGDCAYWRTSRASASRAAYCCTPAGWSNPSGRASSLRRLRRSGSDPRTPSERPRSRRRGGEIQRPDGGDASWRPPGRRYVGCRMATFEDEADSKAEHRCNGRLAFCAPERYQFGMRQTKRTAAAREATARTIRFPVRLRARIAADAERCGRSFEAQVLAILRRHYGESVDILPTPSMILGLAQASLAGMSAADRALVTARLEAE